MKITNFLITAFFITLTSSCDEIWGNVISTYGTGDLMTETRSLPYFDKIQARMGADINIIESDSSYIEIEAQQNILDIMETEVKNGTLFIHFGRYNIQTSKTICINIHTKNVDKFEFFGAGNVVSDLSIADISVSGSGNIKCQGQGHAAKVRINGAGTIDLFDMPVNVADINISGSGTVKVNASQELAISISGLGTVFYLGYPEISRNISGIGNIISQND